MTEFRYQGEKVVRNLEDALLHATRSPIQSIERIHLHQLLARLIGKLSPEEQAEVLGPGWEIHTGR